MEIEKELYWNLCSENAPEVTLSLEDVFNWIKADVAAQKLTDYTLNPVWLTPEEYRIIAKFQFQRK